MTKAITTSTIRSLTSPSSNLTLRGRTELDVTGYHALPFPKDRQVGWIDIPSLCLSYPAKGTLRIPILPSDFSGSSVEEFSRHCRRIEFTPSLGSGADFAFLRDLPPHVITSVNLAPAFQPYLPSLDQFPLPDILCLVFTISQRNWHSLDALLDALPSCRSLQCVVLLTRPEGGDPCVGDSLRYRDPRIRPLFTGDLISWSKAPSYIYLSTATQETFPPIHHIYIDQRFPFTKTIEDGSSISAMDGTYNKDDIRFIECGGCFYGPEGATCYRDEENTPAIIDWILSHPLLERLILGYDITSHAQWVQLANSPLREIVIHGQPPRLTDETPFPPLLTTFSCCHNGQQSQLALLCSHEIRNLRILPWCGALGSRRSVETILATPGLERVEFSLYDDVDCDGIELSESSSLTHLSIKTERRIYDEAPGWRLIVDDKHGLRGFALLSAALYSYPLTSLSVKDICFVDQEDELNNQAYKRLSSLSHISIELYDDCDFAFGYCESGFYKILPTCKGLQTIDIIVDMACDDADIAHISNMIRTLAEATNLRELSYSVSPPWTMEQWEVVRGLQDHPLLFSPLLTLLGAEGLTDCTIFLRNSAPEPSKARKVEITAQTLLDLYRLITNDKP